MPFQNNFIKIFQFFFLFCILSTPLSILNAQLSVKELKQKAEEYLKSKDYLKALSMYRQLSVKEKTNFDWKYKQGICHFYLNKFDRALPFFNNYLTFKKHDKRALFYTARTLHYTEKWSAAIQLYKMYLRVIPENSEERIEIKKLIMQCLTAIKGCPAEVSAIVVNMGDSLNSRYDDIAPQMNKRLQDQLFFSSNRKGKYDILYSQLLQANWSFPLPLPKRYNSTDNDILVTMPDAGFQILYHNENRLMVDNYLDGFYQNLAVPFEKHMNADSWNGDHYFFSENLMIFSSDRPGGFGGKDIYYCFKDKEGKWSEPQNAGPFINSIHNERSPFISTDGKVLYFSSDRLESIGGYDIFKSVFIEKEKKFGQAKNMGKPINSSGDELFFKPLENGMNAYLSSARNDGQGAFDLYSVFFRRPLAEQNPSDPKKIISAFAIIQSNMKDNEPDVAIQFDPGITTQISNEPVKLQSVLYNAETGDWNPGTDKQIDNALRLLAQNPNLKLIINAHSDDLQELYLSLFLSVQQADLFATNLVKKGISADRILLRGCAGQFPQAKKYRFDGSLDENAPKLNNRIDFEINGPRDSSQSFENNKIVINQIMKDNAADFFNTEQIGLRYKIQFISTSTLYNNPVIKAGQFIICEKKPFNPTISYLMGNFSNYETSKTALEQIKNSGFELARLVAYIDGLPIDKDKAKELSAIYPDLQKYVESED